MAQPLDKLEWISRDRLQANGYNPNHVAKTELALLKQSILATGWTQPIVAREDGEIVDGFHRWTVSADPKIAALTNGLIPVVWIPSSIPEADQMAATIRHNRARGEHGIRPMAEIVQVLIDRHGWDVGRFMTELGMEAEEVQRLADRAGMTVKGSGTDFSNGWVPR